MRLGICSFSLHRTVAAGKMDFAGFVALNRRLGCTTLDPWCAHLEGGGGGSKPPFSDVGGSGMSITSGPFGAYVSMNLGGF